MTTPILYRRILHNVEQSFSYVENTPFTQPLHYHEEYELIYITSGSGKEFIGDAVSEYKPGYMAFIGSNIPHLHLCNSVINHSEEKSVCEILQFPSSIFPSNIDEIKEYSIIYSLLKESSYGIKFHSAMTIKRVLKIMQGINQQRGIERIISLYRILDILGKSKHRELVSSLSFQSPIAGYSVNEPVSKVYAYLRNNFNQPVTLKSIADYVNQDPASLCRCFKQKTDKTIFEYLNEIRIEHACKLLLHSNLTNSQIAYEVGFNNISYFNKVFKSITHGTPSQYKSDVSITPEL